MELVKILSTFSEAGKKISENESVIVLFSLKQIKYLEYDEIKELLLGVYSLLKSYKLRLVLLNGIFAMTVNGKQDIELLSQQIEEIILTSLSRERT